MIKWRYNEEKKEWLHNSMIKLWSNEEKKERENERMKDGKNERINDKQWLNNNND
jgi:hypothetical protein